MAICQGFEKSPELLKPFADAKPVSQAVINSRKRVAAVLAAARKTAGN